MLLALVLLERATRVATRNADAAAVSKALGALVVVASFCVKVPQIVVLVVQSRTADGLFPLSLYAAVVSLTLTSVFHGASRSPPTAWGDALAVLAQDLMLVALRWRYSRTPLAVRGALSAGLVALSAAAVAAAARAPPPPQRAGRLWPLLALSTAISLAGVVAQVVPKKRNTHTGPSSLMTQQLLTERHVFAVSIYSPRLGIAPSAGGVSGSCWPGSSAMSSVGLSPIGLCHWQCLVRTLR